MASAFGAGGSIGSAQTRRPQNLVFEEIVPSSGWTEDSDTYCLIISLPGFKKNELNLQADYNGHIIVSGDRQVNEMKHVCFQQSYKVPDKSNIEDTTAKFEDDILYIVIPKKTTQGIIREEAPKMNVNSQQPDHPQEENIQNGLLDKKEVPDPAGIRNDITAEKPAAVERGKDKEEQLEEEEFHDAKGGNQWNNDKGDLLGTLKVQLIKNKGVIVTAILAFSLGVYVSQKFQTYHGLIREGLKQINTP